MREAVMEETCVKRASEAYLRKRSGDRTAQLADAEALMRFGLLSNRNIEAITGLPEAQVAALTRKTDHVGGRLSVDTLPLLVQIADDWEGGHLSLHLLQAAVRRGTSQTMLAKLTGIPEWTVRRALR